MCDYSLCGLPARLANEGEQLVLHRFRSGSMGLAPQPDLVAPEPKTQPKNFWGKVKRFLFEDAPGSVEPMVVCMPPGAELILKGIPADLQCRWCVGEEEHAFFVQTNATAYNYRDAVRFWNGNETLLQSLPAGIRVVVVSLGDSATPETGRELAEPVLRPVA
jgi:hypothetical protein